MFLGRTSVSNFSASKYWVAAVMFVFVWGFNQITGATKREVGEQRSTCFCVALASTNMYNWCSVVCSVMQDLHGFAIQWPQVVFIDVFQCHRAAPAMLRFAGVAPSDQLISFFAFLPLTNYWDMRQKWDDLVVMQTRYRTDVDVDINLETNYIDTQLIYACKTLCIQQKSTKYHVTAKASFSSCSRLLLLLDCKTATSKATYT